MRAETRRESSESDCESDSRDKREEKLIKY